MNDHFVVGQTGRQPAKGSPPLIALVGPTASGKSALAVQLCRQINGAIISADSRQIYRGLDIGTAKPGVNERCGIDHYLLDIRAVDEHYSLHDFLIDANAAIVQIRSRRQQPVVVGGTGLYVQALLEGFHPGPIDRQVRAMLEAELASKGLPALRERLSSLEAAISATVDRNNPRRVIRAIEQTLADHGQDGPNWPDHPAKVLGIAYPSACRAARIGQRTDQMLAAGLLDEVRRVLYSYGRLPILASSIGYRECAEYLLGSIDLPTARDRIVVATRRYARRQMTFLRNKIQVQWLECDRPLLAQALDLINRH